MKNPPKCYIILFFEDIEDLPPNVQEKLFDEVLDRDVQKGKVTCSILKYFLKQKILGGILYVLLEMH